MKNKISLDNEIARIRELSEINIDISTFGNSLKDLAELGAKITGAEISLINVIDANTQWTISHYGLNIEQMPREDSVCQYTILGDEPFEVKDLVHDSRFHDKFYVAGDPNLTYYFGMPLRSGDHNIGAICVLDKHTLELSAEKKAMLDLVSKEVMNRLNMLRHLNRAYDIVNNSMSAQRRVLHDIKGPITSMIGLADAINTQRGNYDTNDVQQFINMIYLSGKSVLELTDNILAADSMQGSAGETIEVTLLTIKERLQQLYMPQTKARNIHLWFEVNQVARVFKFPPGRLMSIIGHILNNTIKFTPANGLISVKLDMAVSRKKIFQMRIEDTGKGLTPDERVNIMDRTRIPVLGLVGEHSYETGLAVAKDMLESVGGSLTISSATDKSTVIEIAIPLAGE